MRTESPLHQLSSLVREGVPEGVMLGIHHIPSEALLTRSPFPAFEAVWTHCLARTSGDSSACDFASHASAGDEKEEHWAEAVV